MDFDAETVGPPPRLEALLRGPQFPEFPDLCPVRALDDDLSSGRVASGWGLTLVVHVSCSLLWVFHLTVASRGPLPSGQGVLPTNRGSARATYRVRGKAPA